MGDTTRRVLQAVRDHWSEHRYPPTVRELADATGIQSPSTIHRHLTYLREDGQVAWTPGHPRTLILTDHDQVPA